MTPIIITIPFIDHHGDKQRRQILIRGLDVPDPELVTVDIRDDEGFAWTPITLMGGGHVEFRVN